MSTGAFDSVDRETKFPGTKLENGADAGDIMEEINRGVDDGGLRPVLLIKTISPTVSRVQLEQVCFSCDELDGPQSLTVVACAK